MVVSLLVSTMHALALKVFALVRVFTRKMHTQPSARVWAKLVSLVSWSALGVGFYHRGGNSTSPRTPTTPTPPLRSMQGNIRN